MAVAFAGSDFPEMAPVRIPVSDVALGLSRHLDMVHPDLKDHHHLTARIAVAVGRAAGYSEIEIRRLSLAALLHDAGALSLRERLRLQDFDADIGLRSPSPHAEAGYILMAEFAPFKPIAEIVRHHHAHWAARQEWEKAHGPLPSACHILHVADRAAVMVDKSRPILNQSGRIRDFIRSRSGTMFSPEFAEAFDCTAEREAFWLEITDPEADTSVSNPEAATWLDMDRAALDDLAKLFCRFIDLKSPYTAVHSSGVAGTAEALALRAGLPLDRAFLLRIAGFLHDVGKAAVPTEFLEKPGSLTPEEYSIVKGHAYYTGRILRGLKDLGPVRDWAALHHEQPNGRGYPYRRGWETHSLEARIVAVADVYTALREDRPQRSSADFAGALHLMESMAREGALDSDLTALLGREREFVDYCREDALAEARSLRLRLSGGLEPEAIDCAPLPEAGGGLDAAIP